MSKKDQLRARHLGEPLAWSVEDFRRLVRDVRSKDALFWLQIGASDDAPLVGVSKSKLLEIVSARVSGSVTGRHRLHGGLTYVALAVSVL